MTKILIVDDEPSIRSTLSRFLTDAGYEVEVASDVAQAMALLHGRPFDVVVTDIILPRVSGVELLRMIKAEAPQTHVIIMTGEPTAGTAIEAVRAGAYDYLPKPISKDEIRSVVARASYLREVEADRQRLETANREYQEHLKQLIEERTEALLQTEERYRNLVETTFDWVWEVDAQGRYIYASPRVKELLGYTPAEILGRTPFDLMPEEESRRVKSRFEQAVAERRPFSLLENTNIHRDGHLVVLETNGMPILGPDGTVLGYRGMDRDITERKRAIEALARLNAKNEMVLNSVAEGILGLDANGVHTFVNPAAARMLGYTPEELVGRPSHNLWHHTKPDGRPYPEGECLVLRSIREGVVHHVVAEIFWRKDGTSFPVEYTATPVYEQGRPAGAVVTFADITERKLAEERLLRQSALLDAANDAIYVRTMDHTVTYWNEGAVRLYGWSCAEALGRKISDLAEVDPEAFAAANHVLLERGSWQGELKRKNKAGNERVVFCRWTLLRDTQGQPSEVLAINTDVTEMRILEANFLRAQRQESIGALAGGIAHDLNNILAPILIAAPFLRDSVTDPENRATLTTIESCAQRGADIIKQLLTFARGKPGARVPLPPRHLLREMDKIIRETFPRNIQPSVNLPKDLWLVVGDATQIHQSLLNLCVNARDAMPQGGQLALAAENRTLDAEAARTMPDAKPGKYVCISVCDTGEGIPPENLERIFDPFFTTKELGKGTGLGLATVIGIVRGHEGFIRVSSQVGHGTTFELYLPASPVEQVQPLSEDAPPLPRGAGELVLVVDDEPAVRGIVQRTLKRYGYEVLTAAEGREALVLFEMRHGDVKAVITDMMMPGMDGQALIRDLRRLEPRIPILAMTGLTERLGIKDLEHHNLVVVLGKPFSVSDILTQLHRALTGTEKERLPS
jgi:PAS domain S-box-containing protein